ncbi:helix-turn-helix domain-containing protein [Virgibacillus pantothenticus]|uniref:helix-turn-helix domain-containing protein n=1 Tax=Virgibacillus pantothenticus TaxID=1473 RepID=UPI00067DFA78|nr:helix-turn-helix transcriptional regulator [Virgibacillus pantothenticus]MED3735886.1 helix-turn-helix transcriptional regulator [Virgibacillus pantothenticus]SIT15079.1 DNA-binding transcriptional regulator, XRE-family HTH domain [Virgibacillus pantothenticus]
MDNRIREIRQQKKISGTKIAKQLGISAQYFYDIEKGERNLSAELAVKIADILGVSVSYLLNNDNGGFVGESESQHYGQNTRLVILETLQKLTDDEGKFFEDLRKDIFDCLNEILYFYFDRENLSRKNYSYNDFKEYFSNQGELTDTEREETIEEFNLVFNYNTFKQILSYLKDDEMEDLLESLNKILNKHGLDEKTPSHEKEFLDKLELSDEKLLEEFNLVLDGKKLTEDEAKGIIAYLRSLRQFDK